MKNRPGAQLITDNHVHIEQALKTPQFYQLWLMLCPNVTTDIAMIGVAKTMITDIFSPNLPDIVDATFAATYLLMISVFNMMGRFLWASTSDYIGRKNTYTIFFLLGYLSIPFLASQASISPAVIWLILFYAVTMLIFTMYGGSFSTIPAYLADMFGTLHVGGIHGRLLNAWSTAGILGSFILIYLQEQAIYKAIYDLSSKADPAIFFAQFGATINQLDTLISTNTVSIVQRMQIVPSGTVDPTPSLYNTTMYSMAALLIIGLLCNALIRPVHSRHHIENSHSNYLAQE